MHKTKYRRINIGDTRWECMIDSVKAVRYQTAAVYDALVEVSENANDPKARTEATDWRNN